MLQRLSERINQWPIEEWASEAGRQLRRVRRRLARRKTRVAVVVASACLMIAVGGNALWSQSARHPAPLWSGGVEQRTAFASSSRLPEVIRQASEDGPDDDALASLVSQVQGGLAANGFYDGRVTGELDEETSDAIRSFERARGLAETGEPSLPLLAAVSASVAPLPAAASQPDPVRTVHAPQINVADIQRLLNERGFGPLSVDGKMGRMTRHALDNFAAREGFGEGAGLSPEVLRALAGNDA